MLHHRYDLPSFPTRRSSDLDTPDAILLAAGSEVSLAIDAQRLLKEKNIDVRVVSMPSWDRFEAQDLHYKNSVLLPSITQRLAIDMGSPLGWDRYVGNQGKTLSINTFGASAPGDVVIEKFGFTAENIVQHVEQLLT